ncbi:photosynthesis system II assembly factor Ycf48 [Altericista sp. CCNU0014]|uniref:photosynthesis system II assembly factor Ycf48 n=1 Tax=Altericista sp. CCNU0014 TaxID=3082949 RepID=UPI00384AF561
MHSLQKLLKSLLAVSIALVFCTSCAYLPALENSPWELVSLPTDATVLDLSFVSEDHGWLTGTRSTLMETVDGGKTWEPRQLELGDTSYRFNSISFSGNEGWIAGEPSILLHTEDAGQSWSSIPLSAKLPGKPAMVVAVGPHAAEMTTDVGAIYKTEDNGRHWTAMVQEAFGVLRNVNRAPNGSYVAVSSRGSFYSIWKPGELSWEPHNRNSSRRVQNMGFAPDGQLWMLARGGQIQFSNDANEWDEPIAPDYSVSVGLLDLAYRTPEELWVTGGSGNLLCSFDGGKTWQKDRSANQLATNLYRVMFQSPDRGFVLGQSGILLRYVG